jgi:NADPH:quinone reductase-like Zn-dependent oxidoreductase
VPTENEVLVRVHAASQHVGNWVAAKGVPYIMRPITGLLDPRNRIPGDDIAAAVEAVGTNVKQLQPGHEVFGWCKGAFSEYACAAADNSATNPANLTFEQASAGECVPRERDSPRFGRNGAICLK